MRIIQPNLIQVLKKDNILNTATDNKSRVASTTATQITLASDIVTGSDELLVNLTNQIEYIFEIKTQEPDPTSQIRPSI